MLTAYAPGGGDDNLGWSSRFKQKEQEAHHKVGLGETPRRLIWKLCRYSSFEKFGDAFEAAVHLSKAASRTISEL